MIYQLIIRLLLTFYHLALRITIKIKKGCKKKSGERYDILITGTFYSGNWLHPHLQPLAISKKVSRVRMVATSPVPEMSSVYPVYPPDILIYLIGAVPARLLTFIWYALKDRPDVIGGFHLLLNGLLAIFLARLIGSHSLYFCGGGPREVIGGGIYTENRIFRRLYKPNQSIEKQLIKSIKHCNIIVVMGSGAATFFKENGVNQKSIHIIPGGFSSKIYFPSTDTPIFDLITVGRISSVKRIDTLIESVSLLKYYFPNIKTLIVGDGPLKKSLQDLTISMGLRDNVTFVGHQDNVAHWLRQAKIFVMTSDSEGVSQAMIQAMLCGLPPVVSDVGDLRDLVIHESNGYLIKNRLAINFSDRIRHLLINEDIRIELSKAAYYTALQHSTTQTASNWDFIL
ncbi:glycosyltransferase [Desulfopila aestuarii]|uniref:Glycosyltransferase involved in cell wall bisynthesis n=1 Tax=Desulfopila aestuarii DSM 18488 TaxID=1121416 RepID=A0A1M7YFX2_9BACT|nr:glycosyltransferase [Desulfopila aestuarii]SHO51469.1 Glycosyltransferase involved in cell wall bisynthesis [Desulfopila aestuarii DSM 18488]